ncbi:MULTISPECIES: hypothetical protein [Paenibacillus]|uniref:hypothetical protein n=1 Tax=Paenibacillus TaxID=44249 RepID=UPI0022B8D51F|nr:hypothetical protein [Paenibacillus caseinilyticus]MCZ8520836.1 hypothetical protein [Paenibacillus caseinilyticus]
MISIHDNEITSYKVDLKNHKITFHTLSPTNHQEVEVLFVEVLAHQFEAPLEGSIIFGIQEYELDRFIDGNRNLLEKQKKYCWPMYYDNMNDLSSFLKKENYLYYVIQSSYGLNGWVVAKLLEIRRTESSE